MEDDLIALLCTRIGMIMEDAAPMALTIQTLEPALRLQSIGEIGKAVRGVTALLEAVKVLEDTT